MGKDKKIFHRIGIYLVLFDEICAISEIYRDGSFNCFDVIVGGQTITVKQDKSLDVTPITSEREELVKLWKEAEEA